VFLAQKRRLRIVTTLQLVWVQMSIIVGGNAAKATLPHWWHPIGNVCLVQSHHVLLANTEAHARQVLSAMLSAWTAILLLRKMLPSGWLSGLEILHLVALCAMQGIGTMVKVDVLLATLHCVTWVNIEPTAAATATGCACHVWISLPTPTMRHKGTRATWALVFIRAMMATLDQGITVSRAERLAQWASTAGHVAIKAATVNV